MEVSVLTDLTHQQDFLLLSAGSYLRLVAPNGERVVELEFFEAEVRALHAALGEWLEGR